MGKIKNKLYILLYILTCMYIFVLWKECHAGVFRTIKADPR